MPPGDDLERLVDRAKGGERAAFDAIAEQFRARLVSLVRFRLSEKVRQRVDVEDLVQETYLRAFQALPSFHWESSPGFVAWLTAIAENACREALRRNVVARRQSMELEVPLVAPVSGPSPAPGIVNCLSTRDVSPSTLLRREERLVRLEKALGELSELQREVLIQSFIQRLPTSTIAARLDMKPSAVCMLRTRALRKLRDLLGPTDSFRLPDRPLHPS